MTYCQQRAAADEVVREIERDGGRAAAIPLDVRSRESVRAGIAQVEALFGGLDILVNNAGANKPADFDQITDADWDEILAVNLKGPFVCAQEALPALRRRGGGSIVNIGSVSGQYGGPRTAHYAASKAGLISLGQVIARFGAKDNIRCNTVAAGLIASEMAATGMQSEAVQKVAAGILLRPARHARGSRPGGGVPRVGRQQLHHGADHQRQRRTLFLTRSKQEYNPRIRITTIISERESRLLRTLSRFFHPRTIRINHEQARNRQADV